MNEKETLEAIRKIEGDFGLSDMDIEEITHISRTSLSHATAGRRGLSESVMLTISKFLVFFDKYSKTKKLYREYDEPQQDFVARKKKHVAMIAKDFLCFYSNL